MNKKLNKLTEKELEQIKDTLLKEHELSLEDLEKITGGEEYETKQLGDHYLTIFSDGRKMLVDMTSVPYTIEFIDE